MKAVLALLLCATATSAVPFTSHLQKHLTRRFVDTPLDAPQRRKADGVHVDNDIVVARSDTRTSVNWAGAIIYDAPSGASYTNAKASFKVPDCSLPAVHDANTEYAAAVWVGINGNHSDEPFIQAGCDCFLGKPQPVSSNLQIPVAPPPDFRCWWEWWPDPHHEFPDFKPEVGDVIDISVTSTPPSQGSVTLVNQRTKQQASNPTMTAGKKEWEFTGKTVQWIVEDYSSNGANVPFANFGTVTFTGCEAHAGNDPVPLDSALIWELGIDGKTLTSSSVSGSDVVVKYL